MLAGMGRCLCLLAVFWAAPAAAGAELDWADGFLARCVNPTPDWRETCDGCVVGLNGMANVAALVFSAGAIKTCIPAGSTIRDAQGLLIASLRRKGGKYPTPAV